MRSQWNLAGGAARSLPVLLAWGSLRMISTGPRQEGAVLAVLSLSGAAFGAAVGIIATIGAWRATGSGCSGCESLWGLLGLAAFAMCGAIGRDTALRLGRARIGQRSLD